MTAQATTEEQEQQKLLLREMEALRMILNKGLAFDVPKRSLLKYLSKKKVRTLTIYKPYLDTMDIQAEIFLKMRIINENAIAEDFNSEKNLIVKNNVRLAARAIAISLLNKRWKINVFGGLLTKYLLSHLDSEKLRDVSSIIEMMGDAGNFINSIRSMTGMHRTSQPKRIEEQVAA